MKKFMLILIVALSFLSASWGEWILVTNDDLGSKYYIDFDKLKLSNDNVYFWTLTNYLIPTVYDDLSVKTYHELDCTKKREKFLNYIFYKKNMGQGESINYSPENPEWNYISENSVGEDIVEMVCAYKNKLKIKFNLTKTDRVFPNKIKNLY